ncbi:hypothetical protein KIW84_041472 [Lathyrus oleraceus]|uniref:Uncharacterized protein n=1 Tax=Pisum sativum TaxID=3888 RepID=A0A9D4XA54_PEA|nr:hypothetical protein KIW84_041472 [Pisum sativum]
MHGVLTAVACIMASNRGRVSRGSSSRASLTPSAPTFPNFEFLSEAHAEIFLKIVDYHVVKEKAFDLSDLRGFEEIGENLHQRKWVSFNYLIHETNNTIDLEFYANVAFGDSDSYTSYVRGVLFYPEDKRLTPKVPLNVAAIQKLQCINKKVLNRIKKEINKSMRKNSSNHKNIINHSQCKVNKLHHFKGGWKLMQMTKVSPTLYAEPLKFAPIF